MLSTGRARGRAGGRREDANDRRGARRRPRSLPVSPLREAFVADRLEADAQLEADPRRGEPARRGAPFGRRARRPPARLEPGSGADGPLRGRRGAGGGGGAARGPAAGGGARPAGGWQRWKAGWRARRFGPACAAARTGTRAVARATCGATRFSPSVRPPESDTPPSPSR